VGFTQINGSYVLFLVPSVYESNKMCHTPAAQVLKMKAQPQERRAKHPKAIMVQPWQNRLVRKHWIYVISMDISISAYKIYYIVYNICIYTYVYIYIHIHIYIYNTYTYICDLITLFCKLFFLLLYKPISAAATEPKAVRVRRRSHGYVLLHRRSRRSSADDVTGREESNRVYILYIYMAIFDYHRYMWIYLSISIYVTYNWIVIECIYVQNCAYYTK
jgi:phosphatidylserine decarboxylase